MNTYKKQQGGYPANTASGQALAVQNDEPQEFTFGRPGAPPPKSPSRAPTGTRVVPK